MPVTEPARDHGFAPPATASWAAPVPAESPVDARARRRPAEPVARLPRIALWCGIIALLGGILYGWTLPVALVAIVLGTIALARGRGDRRRALIGLIFGVIGLALSGAWLAYSMVMFARLLTFTS